MNKRWFYIVWTFIFLALIFLVALAELAGPESKAAVFDEGGLVENLSAAGYFIGFILLCALMIVRRYPTAWSMAVVVLSFGFRELDFDKRFTTMGIFKSRFLTSNEVPADERIIGILVILSLLVCAVFLLKDHLKPFLKGLREREPCALSVLFAGAALVLSKSIDGIARKLEPFGVEISESLQDFFGVLEESLETAAPCLLILAIVGAFFRLKPADAGEPAAPESRRHP